MSERATPSDGRPEQARTRFARRAVVAAARELFVDGGYTATTIDAISARAEVPSPTVYRLFGSKLGILEALLDVSIAGDDAPVAVADRPDLAAVLAQEDPQELLAGAAAFTTAINERTSDVYQVLAAAADADPGAAELLAEIARRRAQGQAGIVKALERRHALGPGVTRRTAEDLVHALMSPELHRLLVGERGWSASRYRTWLGGTLVAQLLHAP